MTELLEFIHSNYKREGMGFYSKLSTLCYCDNLSNISYCWQIKDIKVIGKNIGVSPTENYIQINDIKLQLNSQYKTHKGFEVLKEVFVNQLK